MLATLCYAARRRTSFNCACYVLKGLRATPVDAAILLSALVGRRRGERLVTVIQQMLHECQMSEPGLEGF